MGSDEVCPLMIFRRFPVVPCLVLGVRIGPGSIKENPDLGRTGVGFCWDARRRSPENPGLGMRVSFGGHSKN